MIGIHVRLIAVAVATMAVASGALAAQPEIGIRPVTSRDHIRGDLKAPVKIIEFSDTECPLCKRLYPTLQQVVQQYSGKVAWVYRHLPVKEIHPRALKEAEATECAAELGGNDKFWAYLDRVFEVTPSNDRLDPAELPRIAIHVGLDSEKFGRCLKSDRHAGRVAEDAAEAIAAGAPGTPYSLVVAPNGKTFAVVGAQPYESWELVVDIALEQRQP
jgi:protein-disulfide isomerase